MQTIDHLTSNLSDNTELFDMSKEEGDEGSLVSIDGEATKLEETVAQLEFRRMFNKPEDPLNCFIDIQAGAGGTEACDWASMLLRQYLKYCERKGFKTTMEDESEGDIAGIKGATIKVEGDYAFGLLRTETGVHRLVRKSPFDSAGGRHTSFASIFVYPEVDDTVEIDINPSDVRTDTFAPAAQAASTSTRPTLLCASRTFPPASSCNVRMAAASTATATWPGSACARACTTTKCASAWPSSKSSKTPRPTWDGATRSALMCWTRAASRTFAPMSKSATRRRCSMAIWTLSSKPA